ncbi:MAG: hypothetical protein FWG74_05270 [Planctomycetes bacterium]|nr:hypothetical protein [Planctomycetota bacterium]
MPATRKRPVRSRLAPPRREAVRPDEAVVVELPDTAVITLRDGHATVALAAVEYRQWLEDQLDITDSLAALADRQPRQTFEDVMRELEIKA